MLEAGGVPFFRSSSRFSWSMVFVHCLYPGVDAGVAATFVVGIVAGVATAKFAVRTCVFAAAVGIVGIVEGLKKIVCRRRAFGVVLVVLTPPKYLPARKARCRLIVRPQTRGPRSKILRPLWFCFFVQLVNWSTASEWETLGKSGRSEV